MTMATRLTIRNFAQIAEVDVKFGDLTVLVGAQGTGKSLALQWLKAALDGKRIIATLRDAGHVPQKDAEVIDLIFGVGMGAAWGPDSEVLFRSKKIRPMNISRFGGDKENVFFIPAHRSALISDGWAAPFQKLTPDTPVVARIFSQNLFDRFIGSLDVNLFPRTGHLKKEFRDLINRSVFHGGRIALEQDQQQAKRLKLTHKGASLPFMTWTAGQREFTPLLLGLYHLLPRTRFRKQEDIDWVVIEEPEMGLHPEALTAALLLVLDLLWRGYKVAISTHSPHVLTAVWMLQRLKRHKARKELVCEGFGVPKSAALKRVAESALKKNYMVYVFEFGEDGKVRSQDISNLDPDAESDAESGWGGLTGFTSRFGGAVRTAVNEQS